MATTKLLDFKNQKNAKNPKFVRQDNYKKSRLPSSWRKPRGWDSKLRKRMQGQAVVDPGYGSPKELRGVHKSGLVPVVVKNLEELKKQSPKENIIIVSGRIGMKKRLLLLEAISAQKFKVLNIKNPDAYIKEKQDAMSKKKETKVVKKEEKAKEEVKKEEKESIEDKLSDEEKKKLEKKEIDRLLTKKF